MVSNSKKIINDINNEIDIQKKKLERINIINESLKNSNSIFFNLIDDALDFINDYAPEHYIINVKNEDYCISKLVNAGSVFLGNYTPESAGDYASGTNHTLPTNGYAKQYSGVNTDSLVLGSTFIIGGQIRGQQLELYMVYPQGNYIRPADSKPYLVIGEVKYGKPILDRVITPSVSIGDASRCALISMDSTLKSDLTVGPPIDIAVYKKDEKKMCYLKCLNTTDDDYAKVCNQWSQGIFKIFDSFQRFDWE